MRKTAEKTAARKVQESTGRSYQDSLHLVRSWIAQGLRWEDELKKLPQPAAGKE